MLHNSSPEISTLVDSAHALAADACAQASLIVVPLESAAEAQQAVDVLNGVWGAGPSSLPSHMLRALAHTGNYVMGLYDVDHRRRLLGVSIAFFADPSKGVLHSHITGILPENQGRRLGTAVKLHQRAWALERDIRAITWTYDPLVSRNAHFNLVRLGARADAYHRDFYGAAGDSINQGEDTDRLHVTWPIHEPWSPSRLPAVPAADAQVLLRVGDGAKPTIGELAPSAEEVLVGVPHDIETMRSEERDLSLWWRRSVRDALQALLDRGYRIEGFTADGQYLLRRTP